MIATRTLIFAGVAAAFLPALSFAMDTRNQGYLVDINGAIVTSATTGDCWRDSDFTPARAVGCNPAAPVRQVQVPAPVVAAVAAPIPEPQAAAPQPAPQAVTPPRQAPAKRDRN